MKRDYLFVGTGAALGAATLAASAPRLFLMGAALLAAAVGVVWASRCRHRDGLGLLQATTDRDGRFRIDDRVCHDRAALPLPSVVSSDAFTFAVEPVSGRL